MGISGHVGIENCSWRLNMVQKLFQYCWLFLYFWAQNNPISTIHILFSSVAYCKRLGLTNKSDHGGGKEKSLSYLHVLINHILEHAKSD